jgi:MFS family permease
LKIKSNGSLASAIATGEDDPSRREAIYRKITWRIMPLLILCYVANFIDRSNIGLAQIPLSVDLGITKTIYGVGLAFFFVGFILFEIPSNIFLHRYGIRKTLLRIMVAWGLVSSCTMFIRSVNDFYAIRLLLGIAEAGFFPGVLLYITYWFPPSRRARAGSLLFLALPISAMIGPLSSGWIMHVLEGTGGLRGWQWMFLLQGLPAVVLGIVAFFYFSDRIKDATWLTEEEKQIIQRDLDAELSVKARGKEYGIRQMLRDPRVYVLGALVCGTTTLANAITYWSPLMLRQSGVGDVLIIGRLSTIPPVIGILIMLGFARHSDRHGERRWHFAITQFAGASALLLASIFLSNTALIVVSIALMMGGHYSGISVFSAIPSIYLSDQAKAAGIALVNTIGTLGAICAPIMLGSIADKTGSLSLGLQVSALVVSTGGILCLVAIPSRLLRER